MNKLDITNVDNLSINKLLNMNKGQIKGLVDGNENNDAINVKQLNEMESTIGNYVKREIAKVNTSLKKYFNDILNYAIAEHGYRESLICVFYLDNNQFNNGDKISKLPDKKEFFFPLMTQIKRQKVGNLPLMTISIFAIYISEKNNV